MTTLKTDDGDKGQVRRVAMPPLETNLRGDEAFEPGLTMPSQEPERSTVPYSVIFQCPTSDIAVHGREQFYIKLALESLDDLEPHFNGVLVGGIFDIISAARGMFHMGYHRFECVVGDWSLKIYKQPDPTHAD